MASEAAFIPREDLNLPLLEDFLNLDDSLFRKKFSGSPIKRIGRDRFIRNVLIALGNSSIKAPSIDLLNLLNDPSSLVRAMCVWVLGRILPINEMKELSTQHLKSEMDKTVREEWDLALSVDHNADSSINNRSRGSI